MQATFKRSQIVSLILLIEALVLLLATAWSFLANIQLIAMLNKISWWAVVIGIGCGAAISFTSIITTLIVQKLKTKQTWLSDYLELITGVMAPIFSKFRIFDIVLVALASGFSEEVFYRGVLQTQFGIVIASIIFGLCHFAGLRFVFYVIWAGLAGAIFGILLNMTGSLWPPIIAHIVNNFVSITYLRYFYKENETA